LGFYKNYFHEFLNQQTEKIKGIDYVLFVVADADRVKENFLKHMEDKRNVCC